MAVQTVTGPTRKPRLHDLDSVAEFEEEPRLGALQAVAYDPEPCTAPRTTIALCWEDAEEKVDKTGDGTDWADAIFDPFAQYAGVSCYMGEGQDFAERARKILDLGQSDEIASKIADWVLATGTNITGHERMSAVLALVEQAIRAGYIGQGVILLNAHTATLLSEQGAISVKDGVLQTGLGTPVGVNATIPDGRILGLGAIKVVHSPLREHEANNLRSNTALAIAERVYTVLVDCDFAVYSDILTTP